MYVTCIVLLLLRACVTRASNSSSPWSSSCDADQALEHVWSELIIV